MITQNNFLLRIWNLKSASNFIFFSLIFVLSACGTPKKIKESKRMYANLSQKITNENQSEIKGSTLDGYLLINNDRVYFNGIKKFILGEFDTTLVTLNYFKSLDSTSASTFYYLAQIKGHYNYLNATRADAQKAAELAPNNKWIQTYYAGILAFSEQYDSAAHIFLKVGKENPADRDDSYIAAAKLLQKADKTSQAIAVLDSLLEFKSADDEEIMGEKQSIYLKAGNYSEAIKVTQQLATANPSSPEYEVQLVQIYSLDGQEDRSEKALLKLERNFPKDDDVSSFVFGYYLKKRNNLEIEKTLNAYILAAEIDQEKDLIILKPIGEYIAGNPKDTSVLTDLSKVLEQIIKAKPSNLTAKRLQATIHLYGNDAERGVTEFIQLIEKHPKNYTLWLPVVSYFNSRQKTDSALYYLDRMEVVFPDSSDIPFNRMLIAQDKKSYQEAIHYAEIGLDLAQKQNEKERESDFLNVLGNLYNELKMSQLSDSVYDNLLLKDPDNAMALNNYAYYLSVRGERLEFALNLSKKSLENDYNNPNNLDTYGWILYKLKRYEEARTYLGKAVEVAGSNVSAVLVEHFADNQFQLGDVETALKLWKLIDKAGEGSEFLKMKIKDKKMYE